MSHWIPRCIRCLEFGPHRHFGITITSFPPVAMDGLGLQPPTDIKPLDKLSGDVKCSHSLASFCGFTNPMLWLKELRQFPLATITACDLYCQLLTECPQLMATADIAPSLCSGQPTHRDTHTHLYGHHGASQIRGTIGQAPLPLDIDHCDHGLLTIRI